MFIFLSFKSVSPPGSLNLGKSRLIFDCLNSKADQGWGRLVSLLVLRMLDSYLVYFHWVCFEAQEAVCTD